MQANGPPSEPVKRLPLGGVWCALLEAVRVLQCTVAFQEHSGVHCFCWRRVSPESVVHPMPETPSHAPSFAWMRHLGLLNFTTKPLCPGRAPPADLKTTADYTHRVVEVQSLHHKFDLTPETSQRVSCCRSFCCCRIAPR